MLVSKITPDEVVGVTSKSVDFLIMSGVVSKAVERYVRYAGELEKIVEMENKTLDELVERTDLYEDTRIKQNLLETATVVEGIYENAKDFDDSTYDESGFTLDLGEEKNGDQYYLVVSALLEGDGHGSGITLTIKVQASLDSSEWIDVCKGSQSCSYGCSLEFKRICTMRNINFRYLRFIFNATGTSAEITAKRVYTFHLRSLNDLASITLNNGEFVDLTYPFLNKTSVMLKAPAVFSDGENAVIDGEVLSWSEELFLEANQVLTLNFTNLVAGNKLAEHVIESTPASGDYKIQNYGKDIAVIIKGTDYRYRIYDISHVNALPTVISVQR